MVLLYQGEAEFEYTIDSFQTVDEKAVEVTYSILLAFIAAVPGLLLRRTVFTI
jgi:hypothetical protein